MRSGIAGRFGSPFPALDSGLIDALPVAVYVCDRDARITGFNRRAVELWGREPSRDERFCGSLRMIRPDGSFLPHDQCPMADVLRTGEAVRNAAVIVERPDGSRVSVDVAIVPLTDANGRVTGAINTFQDVAELNRAYERRREEVRAHEEFFALAAHELRNPVNALQLQLVALLRAMQVNGETVSREWAGERISQAVRAVRRLARLVEVLLDVSRITAGRLDLEPEPMDFAQAVHAVVNRFMDQLNERQLTTRLARTTGSWDKLRVEQVVTNLLSNAIKYGEGLPIEIVLEGDDATVCLSVIDHGVGIEPENQKRLFEKFERAVTRRQYGGFGLGLWISHQIVSAMGGHIAVESQPREGSTFRVTLPRQPMRRTDLTTEATS